jgi:hypothetical protein
MMNRIIEANFFLPAFAAIKDKERDLRLSDLPSETQEYMEDYVAKVVPRNRVVYRWFDAYDLEEERP